MAVVPISLLSIAPPQRNVSRMVRKASVRFAVDCHPIYFHLLDESLDGRVDLGTRVVGGGRVDLGTSSQQFKTFRPCRNVDSMLMCSQTKREDKQ